MKRLGLVYFLVLGVLLGCANQHLDTGAIEYRPMISPNGKDVAAVSFRYYQPEQMAALVSAESDRIIEKGSSVGIKLLQAYVCDFAESETFDFLGVPITKRITRGRNAPVDKRCNYAEEASITRNTRGELIVLATAFELDGQRKIEFDKRPDPNDARIVYYDDDVRETGQFLNLSNMPVYGPITYNGGPLYLKLMMIELDEQEQSAQSALLSEIARLGGTAYPPASPVLSALQDIGGQFLAQNGNDLEFRFDMTFDGEGTLTASHAPLAWGNYVFIRQWDRHEPIPWHEFYLDHDTGRLKNRCLISLVDGKKKVEDCLSDEALASYLDGTKSSGRAGGLSNLSEMAEKMAAENSDDLSVKAAVVSVSAAEQASQSAISASDSSIRAEAAANTRSQERSGGGKVIGAHHKDYRQFTYFVIKVTKNESALSQDVYQTLGEFRAQEDPDTVDLSNLNTHFEALGKRVSRNATYDDLRNKLSRLSESPDASVLAAQTWDRFAQVLCAKEAEDEKKPTLDAEQKAYLLRRIGKLHSNLDPLKLTTNGLAALCEEGLTSGVGLYQGLAKKEDDAG